MLEVHDFTNQKQQRSTIIATAAVVTQSPVSTVTHVILTRTIYINAIRHIINGHTRMLQCHNSAAIRAIWLTSNISHRIQNMLTLWHWRMVSSRCRLHRMIPTIIKACRCFPAATWALVLCSHLRQKILLFSAQ